MSIIQNRATFHSDQREFLEEVSNTPIIFAKELDNQIANYLKKTGNKGKTRKEICEFVKAPRSSVYDSINRMSISGWVESDFKANKSNVGRPNTIYFLKFTKQGSRR